MESVFFNCPICQTRYQSEVSEIKSSKPYFQCRSCSTVFAFGFPFEGTPVCEVIQTQQSKTKACPQCGALHFPMDKECYSCGVVFDKLSTNLSENKSPYLSRKWNMVLEDFDNHKKHQAFIAECFKASDLEFGIEAYKKIKEAQGGEDSLCDLRILELQALKGVEKIRNNPKNVFQTAIVVAAALLILIGVVKPYYRNFVGLGVFLCVFMFGVEHIRKGKWG